MGEPAGVATVALALLEGVAHPAGAALAGSEVGTRGGARGVVGVPAGVPAVAFAALEGVARARASAAGSGVAGEPAAAAAATVAVCINKITQMGSTEGKILAMGRYLRICG